MYNYFINYLFIRTDTLGHTFIQDCQTILLNLDEYNNVDMITAVPFT